MPHIGVAGKVGNGGMLCREELAVLQMFIHELQKSGGNLPGSLQVARQFPLGHHARRGRTVLHLPGGNGQPALHPSRGDRLFGQPLAAGRIALDQVDENGIAVREGEVAILQDRNLAQWVQPEKFRAGACRRGSRDTGIGQSEYPQQQLDPMSVPGQFRAVENDSRGCHWRQLYYCWKSHKYVILELSIP